LSIHEDRLREYSDEVRQHKSKSKRVTRVLQRAKSSKLLDIQLPRHTLNNMRPQDLLLLAAAASAPRVRARGATTCSCCEGLKTHYFSLLL
jgi:hypothetical protein